MKCKKGDFEHPAKWLEFVAKRLPLDKVRVRRDWDRFLNLCSAVALIRGVGSKNPVDISFQDYCVAYRILEPVFASVLHGPLSHPTQVSEVAHAVAKLNKHLGRPVTAREVAEELGRKEPVVYRQLRAARELELIRREHGTREKNLKRFFPMDGKNKRFLPRPKSVLKHNRELGRKVKYVDPLTGEWEEVHR